MKDLDDLYEKIGLGERLAPLVARRLLPAAHGPAAGRSARALAIAGTEGLLVTYARCCFPLPHDPVFAFLSAAAAWSFTARPASTSRTTASIRRSGCR